MICALDIATTTGCAVGEIGGRPMPRVTDIDIRSLGLVAGVCGDFPDNPASRGAGSCLPGNCPIAAGSTNPASRGDLRNE